MSSSGPAPVALVMGCGRSGTTLLEAMLDSHPDIAMVLHTRFLVDIVKNQSKYQVGDQLDLDLLAADLDAHERFRRWNLPHGVVGRLFARRRPGSLADALRLLLSSYAASGGKRRYGTKINSLAHHVPALAQLLPETRFVHLIRDGRDVALSYLDVDWGPSTCEEAAVKWRGRVESAREGGRSLPSGRYREVRYERLVEHPEGELRSVCEFLSVSYDPAMLRYHEGDLLSRLGDDRWHRGLRQPPKPMRDWRTQMPATAVDQFEAVAGDLLASLGYECSTQGTG